MIELESNIEKKLIDQLSSGESQWTYRPDLHTEADLWNNFRYILEQNNKAKLNDDPLSDSEFEQVKNQLQFSSFYEAGKWLVGENGVVYVHVQRGNETLHLVVMNQEHISGGTSVYEVINQYQALSCDEDVIQERNRRFDVSLMINGIPLIHIELKNKEHSYMDAFWQIKKYIGEGKFHGIFSAVQMFVVSNVVNTMYFSAANATDLNPKFISGWSDSENKPVSDYLEFAKSVLSIPAAHEMIAKYTVLDNDARKLLLLRPYQIHAIEAVRSASRKGESGFVWHTTGSGKTMTSYKATRNLLMDIPSIEKTIFLIDRKDLDVQTKMAFQSYADNDLVDVDDTDNVTDLIKKLTDGNRQMIVTTIQKLQRMIDWRLQKGTKSYEKIKGLKVAFVVDECHRAVTPATKRKLENFFANSLWYGFTGTPRFDENPYPEMGDLPRTTEQMYGKALHKYTIKEAIHDEAVLGFQVEYLGAKGLGNMDAEEDISVYEQEPHMLQVIDTIINRSQNKLEIKRGKGKSYEAILTVKSIAIAQKYYDLFKRVKRGETQVKISEEITKVLPDFPKVAITYSIAENEEGEPVNQEKMKEALQDYYEMFGARYDLSQIQSYNHNLNDRLARKNGKFKSRDQQLDLVIVVDRLLTGFDAPCVSTIFIDRQPMAPHDLIQAFSRTNRIYDRLKMYGQIVTFQAPVRFKEAVDDAVRLYSAGGTGEALAGDWEETEKEFVATLATLRTVAEKPAIVPTLSKEQKKVFVKVFQHFDRVFAQLKSFVRFEKDQLEHYGITEQEYDDYVAHYRNVMEELKSEKGNGEVDPTVTDDYELLSYDRVKIDYDYIIALIQNIVIEDDFQNEEERQRKIDEIRDHIEALNEENPKLGAILTHIFEDVLRNKEAYQGRDISAIFEGMRKEAIAQIIDEFVAKWYVDRDTVIFAVAHASNGIIKDRNILKEKGDYAKYKQQVDNPLPKFRYNTSMIAELEQLIDTEIQPLQER